MKLFTSFFGLILFLNVSAQNPLIVKTVGGTNAEPVFISDSYGTNNTWNGRVFYQAKSTTPNINLAVTDGTSAGTVFLKNIGGASAALYAGISQMVAAENFIYISTLTYVSGFSTARYELWKSDGTTNGTVLLKSFDVTTTSQILPIASFTSRTSQRIINVVGDVLYFAGYDAINGNEIWKSDGTPGGTLLIKNIRPGNAGSFPQAFCKIGSKILFTAYDGVSADLWQTDGTEAGTTVLKDFSPGNNQFGASGERGVALYKGRMYFYASESASGTEVWSTDGTEAGTNLLIDANPGAEGSIPSIQQSLTFIQDSNYLYFVTRANTSSPYHVWRTDGTAAGTIQLTTAANAVYNSNGISSLGSYATANGIYFVGYSDSLYKTNGTVAGTMRVEKKLNVTRGLFIYKDAAWFIARASNLTDDEAWRSDGLPANTNEALDIYPGVLNGLAYSSSPFGYFELNKYLYFFAKNATGMHLFRYNGDMTFNGSVAGGKWSDSANWNSMIPPGITDTAFINAGATPVINGSNAYAGTLNMQSGSSINLINSTDSLFIHKNLQGTSATGNGVVVFRNFNGDTVRSNAPFTAGNVNAQGAVSLNSNLTITNNLNLTSNARLIINNNNLSLGGTSSTVSNSTNNYVVTNGTGKMSIANIGAGGRAGNVIFPIGSTLNYNPVTLTNAGTMDAFAARTQPGIQNNYSGETPSGSSYTTGAVNNTWFITEGIAGGSNAIINLQWNATQELPGFNRSVSQFGHYNNSSWMLSTIAPATGANPYNVTGAGITSFSPFGVFNNGAVLPLNPFFLSLRKSERNIILNWSNLNNTTTYTVERSTDASSFKQVAVQAAPINTYADALLSGKIFYRLKATAVDGRITYSNIVWINNDEKSSTTIYPTVFTNHFIVQLNAAGSILFQLLNANGQLVMAKQLVAGTNYVDASVLVAGVYYYRLIQGPAVNSGSIIKK